VDAECRFRSNLKSGFREGEVFKVSDTNREMAEIRKRLDLLESRVSSEILNLLAAGDKIGAIKAYRNQTGAGLKDAKDFIESI
jgi:ribosomal protein L7/L12